MSQNGLSRRDFLKGVVAGAVSAATVGVLQGCQHEAAAAPVTTAPAATTPAPTGGAAIFTPGTYSASAKGIASDVKVTMTLDRKSTRLNSSHRSLSRMPSSA